MTRPGLQNYASTVLNGCSCLSEVVAHNANSSHTRVYRRSEFTQEWNLMPTTRMTSRTTLLKDELRNCRKCLKVRKVDAGKRLSRTTEHMNEPWVRASSSRQCRSNTTNNIKRKHFIHNQIYIESFTYLKIRSLNAGYYPPPLLH